MSRFLHQHRRRLIAVAAATAFLASRNPAWAMEQVLDGSGGNFSGLPISFSANVDLATAVVGTIRLLAVIAAIYMLGLAAYGWLLIKHHGGSVDRHKAATGVVHEGLTGFVIATATALAASPLVMTVFRLTGITHL